MSSILKQITELGQSIWYDNIRRGLIASGELQQLVDQGVRGVTSNPSIFHKAITASDDYAEELDKLPGRNMTAMQIYEELAFADISNACDIFRPLYDSSDRRDGFVSIEVNPALADDAEGTVVEARRIRQTIDRPNLMVKVPGTQAGMKAIDTLIGEGLNVNVTLIFSTEVYKSVISAYLSGLERFVEGGGDPASVASVASFFVSRVDTLVDKLLVAQVESGREELRELMGQAAVANAKIAYQVYKEAFGGERFAGLRDRGARVQRPLWASTSTKNPAYPDLIYVDTLIGPDTVNTVPPVTLEAILDHGRARAGLEEGVGDARDVLWRLENAGISMGQVTEQLRTEGVAAFADSFNHLLADLESKASCGGMEN